MGFFSRLFVPRSVRRAMHPGRAVKRAVTPKAVRKASRALHPVDNAVYSMRCIQCSVLPRQPSGLVVARRGKPLSFATVTARSITAARRLQPDAGTRRRRPPACC